MSRTAAWWVVGTGHVRFGTRKMVPLSPSGMKRSIGVWSSAGEAPKSVPPTTTTRPSASACAVEKVRSDYGEGATFTADAAMKAGLIDRVTTMEAAIREAGKGRRPESMGPAPRGYDAGEVAIRARLAGVKL